jgi:DNA repair exonuclease SbcCD ATPase subunit
MSNRPPSREEIESKVTETQARLAELKRAQEVLERERAALEEARRKRIEFQNGREEMLQHLTRGVGILEEAQFAASRNAEQMKLSIADMQAALEKVQAMHEESWSEENWQTELTKALTTLENARMEWNSARVKWTILDGALEKAAVEKAGGAAPLMGQSFSDLCRLGFAFTWPIALVALVGAVGVIIAILAK